MSSLIVALAMALATLPPGGTFVDDDGSVHEGGIEAIAAAGITQGCNPPSNTRYCPGQTVTRGQMAAFLSRALTLPSVPGDHFDDDHGHVFEGAINRIAAAGITVGCNPPSNDHFCPDRSMTRAEMAGMLVRAFAYPPSAVDRFVDDDGLALEAAIDRLAASGVTVGCNPPANDRFCPGDLITREQMATFLTRGLGLTATRPPPRPHPVVPVVSREQWGARPAETSRMVPHVIERLTVHHAGVGPSGSGPALMRTHQSSHMDGQDWPDLAYHFVIGVDGTVYEGRDPRFRGDTATSYDTTGHFLVMLEGNFDVEEPTPAQIDSLTAVLAWAVERYDVSPATIAGHGDFAATACPGRYLEDDIHSGALEAAVADLVDSGGVDLIWP
jgi:hypothetical protein